MGRATAVVLRDVIDLVVRDNWSSFVTAMCDERGYTPEEVVRAVNRVSEAAGFAPMLEVGDF